MVENSDEFFEKYKPIPNDSPDAFIEWGEHKVGFETYGADLERVLAADPKHVWTMVEEDDVMYITAGLHFVNRQCYFITELPWENDTIQFVDRIFDTEE